MESPKAGFGIQTRDYVDGSTSQMAAPCRSAADRSGAHVDVRAGFSSTKVPAAPELDASDTTASSRTRLTALSAWPSF
jgi:hypothetical protein